MRCDEDQASSAADVGIGEHWPQPALPNAAFLPIPWSSLVSGAAAAAVYLRLRSLSCLHNPATKDMGKGAQETARWGVLAGGGAEGGMRVSGSVRPRRRPPRIVSDATGRRAAGFHGDSPFQVIR